ncbi:MAG: hypothetical protein LBQ12_04720 [Deltaproteobacteria bacterium]|jgi:hypothetical protein|nr:hypothetical protein [Deltaproteobacteria bacterium]
MDVQNLDCFKVPLTILVKHFSSPPSELDMTELEELYGGGSQAELVDCAFLGVLANESCPKPQDGLSFSVVGSEPIPNKIDGNWTIFYSRVKHVVVSMPSIFVLVNYLDYFRNCLDGEVREYRLSGSALSLAGLAAVKPNAQTLAPYMRDGQLHFAVACLGGPRTEGASNGADSSLSLVPALSGGGFGAVKAAYVGGSCKDRGFFYRDAAVSRDGTALVMTANYNDSSSGEYMVHKTTVANMHLRAESPAHIKLDSKNAPLVMSGAGGSMGLASVLEWNGAPLGDFFPKTNGEVADIGGGSILISLPGRDEAPRAAPSARPGDEAQRQWFTTDYPALESFGLQLPYLSWIEDLFGEWQPRRRRGPGDSRSKAAKKAGGISGRKGKGTSARRR